MTKERHPEQSWLSQIDDFLLMNLYRKTRPKWYCLPESYELCTNKSPMQRRQVQRHTKEHIKTKRSETTSKTARVKMLWMSLLCHSWNSLVEVNQANISLVVFRTSYEISTLFNLPHWTHCRWFNISIIFWASILKCFSNIDMLS